jgi:hypothetical protein
MEDNYFSKCCELEARLELANQKAWQAEQRVLQLEQELAYLQLETRQMRRHHRHIQYMWSHMDPATKAKFQPYEVEANDAWIKQNPNP